MRRLSCLLVLAGISVLANGQDTSVKITYTAPATRLQTELDEIGKQAKMPLYASPDMARETLVIKVKDLPLSDLMAKIAEATSGSWIPEGTGYRIVIDSVKRRQEANESRLASIRKVTESMKKLTEPLDKKPTLTAANTGDSQAHGTVSVGTSGTNMLMGGGGDSPADRALLRILKLMGPGQLASVQSGDRVVLATNPNGSQISMPSGSTDAITRLVEEQRIFAQAAKKNKKPDQTPPDQNEAVQQIKDMFGIDTDAMTRELAGPPAKVLLTLSRNSLFGGLDATLLLYDTNGKVLLTGRTSIDVGGGLLNMQEIIDATATVNKPVVKPPVNEQEIPLTPLSKQMFSYRNVNRMDPGSLDVKIPDEVRAAMLIPDQRDPLSFAESEGVMALADAKKEQLVANLPDSILQISLFSTGAKLTVSAFEERLKKSAVTTEANGFMVIRPLDPYDARLGKVDRVSLTSFIRNVHGKAFAPLDDVAQYALKNPPPAETPAATSYLMMFAPEAIQGGVGGQADWNMLRFFATLSPPQRQSLAQGRPMQLGNLTPGQISYATKLLFGANAHLQVQDPNAKKSELPAIFDAINMFKLPTDFRSEPTEAMPNGFPRGGMLTLNLNKEPVAKSTSQGMMGMAALGLDELAMLKFFKGEPQFAQVQAYMPNLDQLRLGSRLIYKFTFRVSREASETQTLMDNSMQNDAQIVSMSNLPSDVQKQIDQRVAAFKKLPFFSPAMFGGGKAPPP